MGKTMPYWFTPSVHQFGWSSMMVVILFVSSFQMIGLGIIGEYIWRSLEESRNRPNYVVENVLE